MRLNKYELFSILVGVVAFFAVNYFEFSISEISVQGLLTFLSIAFGFYISAIATLFGSEFAKSLHQQIDEKLDERGTHKLTRHFRVYFLFSALSIAVILILTSTATVLDGGKLRFPPVSLVLWTSKSMTLSFSYVVEGVIYAFAIMNFYYTVILANSILSAFVTEAGKK